MRWTNFRAIPDSVGNVDDIKRSRSCSRNLVRLTGSCAALVGLTGKLPLFTNVFRYSGGPETLRLSMWPNVPKIRRSSAILTLQLEHQDLDQDPKGRWRRPLRAQRRKIGSRCPERSDTSDEMKAVPAGSWFITRRSGAALGCLLSAYFHCLLCGSDCGRLQLASASGAGVRGMSGPPRPWLGFQQPVGGRSRCPGGRAWFLQPCSL